MGTRRELTKAYAREYQRAPKKAKGVMLDELCAAGEVGWRGQGGLAAADGWVTLWPTDLGPLGTVLAEPEGDLERGLVDALAAGGASFFGPLADAVGDPGGMAGSDALWSLVWKGLVTNDTLAPVRARLGGGSSTHRARAAAPRTRYGRPRLRLPRAAAPPSVGGRWSLVEPGLWAAGTQAVGDGRGHPPLGARGAD